MTDDSEHRAIAAAEQAAAMLTTAGMPRMPARAMMALVAAPDGGYTAADLSERLGVSAAAVSGAVRYLQQLRIIERRSRPGDRRDRYELVRDSFYSSMAAESIVYERLALAVEQIAKEQDDDPGAQARAREFAAFFSYLAKRMPDLIAEWQSLRADRLP